MSEKLEITINDEEKGLFSDHGDFVLLPAKGGEIGIYPGHLRLFAELKSGIIKIKNGETNQNYEIKGGFVKIKEDKIEVFSSMFFTDASKDDNKET